MSLLLWVLRALVAVPKLADIIHEIADAIVEERRAGLHADNRDAIERWVCDDEGDTDPGVPANSEDSSVQP